MAGVDVWGAHFGLTRTPFTKTVPADKLFERAAHAEAVARIHYCINEAALGVVVGDTGAGKTVAARAAVAALDRTKFTLVYLSNPSGGCRGLYVAIATALGATPRFHKAEAINQAAALLAAEEHERHRRVIFIVDEAHLLSPEQLEELRLLSNAELDSASPFACLLLGQPTLAVRLRQGIFAALDQRISVRYTIGGMDLAESINYLRHHLAIAGRNDPLVADDAAARLHRYANGLPRALNNAATAALMAAAADGKSLVDDACAKKAIAELHQNLTPVIHGAGDPAPSSRVAGAVARHHTATPNGPRSNLPNGCHPKLPATDRTLKVFAQRGQQAELAAIGRVIEQYDAFAIVEAADHMVETLGDRYLVEDITDQYAIRVGGTVGATIDTSVPRVTKRGTTASHPSYKGARRLAPGSHHYLVQFVGPIKPEWHRAVEEAGGEIVDVHSGFTLIVRATDAQLAVISGIPVVRWVGHLPHQARLDVIEERPTLPRSQYLPNILTVEFFTVREARKARAAIRALGFNVVTDESATGVLVVEEPETGTIANRRRRLDELGAVHGVRMVRRRPVPRIDNDVAIGIMNGTPASLAGVPALDGGGEVVAICDTGFDIGTRSPAHPDFVGRVASVTSYPITPYYAPFIRNPGGDDGGADVDSGHGTHVAGSVLGDGTASGVIAGQAPIRGLAHRARLVFQAVEQALDWRNPGNLQLYGRYVLAGIPVDLTVLLADAYAKRARIHSNSWGGGDPGVYDDQCRQLDQFVREHPSFCVLVSAGNDGTDADGDGAINVMSVTAPATAKNCITVGACENQRHAFDGETYGEWWPDDYPALPFKDAPMADDPDQMVAFSSRGPTVDGRFKPDVVAPGTWILSTKSTMLSVTATAWSPFPPSKRYFYMGGTSMATPLTAGAVALVRQHLRRDRRISRPSAALLKAVLIAGARRIPPMAPNAVVDHHQGYGCVDIGAIVNPAVPAKLTILSNSNQVVSGQLRSTTLTVTASGVPLRVVLAYSDFPGAALVNNLNLVVTAPDGSRRVGNQAEGGPLMLDSASNVEAIHVGRPATGTWTVDVVGSNVPRGPQPYALVARGALR